MRSTTSSSSSRLEAVLPALAGSGTALATGLGGIPVSRLGSRAEQLRPGLWGVTVGLMTVASVVACCFPLATRSRAQLSVPA